MEWTERVRLAAVVAALANLLGMPQPLPEDGLERSAPDKGSHLMHRRSLALLLIVVALGGCGSSAGSSVPHPAVSPATSVRVRARCVVAGLRLERLALAARRAQAKRDFHALGDVLERTAGVLAGLARELATTPVPARDRPAILAYARTLAAQASQIRALGPAVAARRATKAAAITRQMNAANGLLRTQAIAAGLGSCGTP